MSNKKDEMSEEDYLRRHLGDAEIGKNESPFTSDIPYNVPVEAAKVDDLQYFNCDIRELPCGQFYPAGSLFMVRPAKVKEIQAYSMVDDQNFYDIVEKMNDMLSSCVRVKYLDGTIGSYMDIRDPDRYFLIFLIRELTFQKGSSLTTTANCDCGKEVSIELKRENFKLFEQSSRVLSFFDPVTLSFRFEVKKREQLYIFE
jgi:hypothetical protein